MSLFAPGRSSSARWSGGFELLRRNCLRRGGIGGVRLFDVVVERVAGLLPGVETAAQRPHTSDAKVVELHGDLRAGFLGGAGAVEDDVAVARDLIGHGLKFGWTDAHSARKDTWIGQVIERV